MKLSTMQSTVKVEFLFASNTIHRLSYSCVQWSCDHKQLVASDCVDLPAASTKRCVYTTSRKKLCTWDNMGPRNSVNVIWARLTYVQTSQPNRAKQPGYITQLSVQRLSGEINKHQVSSRYAQDLTRNTNFLLAWAWRNKVQTLQQTARSSFSTSAQKKCITHTDLVNSHLVAPPILLYKVTRHA